MAKAQDQTVLLLIKKIEEKRGQIKDAEHPAWKTNCLIFVNGANVNIRTLQNSEDLINVASRVMVYELGHAAALEALGVSNDVPKMCGYPTSDWIADIKTRLTKINVDKEKRNLTKLEERLDKIISPELRAKMEIEAIERELED